jgi:2-alkyl-3-oxoalkanoate reductase
MVRDAHRAVIMRVFVAGASGTIGVPLVKALVDAGHQVIALTRSSHKKDMLRELGAEPALCDALDAAALRTVVESARPTHVIHQLTALPKDGVSRASDLADTNRLRIEGTRNLLSAAIAAGTERFIVGSFAMMQGVGPAAPAGLRAAAAAVKSMEAQTLEASVSRRIAGIILRYGLFYGPGNPATEKMIEMVRRRLLPAIRGDQSLLPCIHVADAVSAAIAALGRGPAGSVYDIVDDQPVSMSDIVRALADSAGAKGPFAVPAWLPRLIAPYSAALTSMRLPLSNDKARAELGWRPAFPAIRDGLAQPAMGLAVHEHARA